MKKIGFLIIISIILFLAFYNSSKINVQGHWNVEKALLNENEVFKNVSDNKSFGRSIGAEINTWTNSIKVYDLKDTIKGDFKIHYDKTKIFALMKSKHPFLNGRFEMEVDTFYNYGSCSIGIELRSDSGYLHLWRRENLEPPLKPRPFQKGRP